MEFEKIGGIRMKEKIEAEIQRLKEDRKYCKKNHDSLNAVVDNAKIKALYWVLNEMEKEENG